MIRYRFVALVLVLALLASYTVACAPGEKIVTKRSRRS